MQKTHNGPRNSETDGKNLPIVTLTVMQRTTHTVKYLSKKPIPEFSVLSIDCPLPTTHDAANFRASAHRFFAGEPTHDYGSRAAHSRIYFERGRRAVQRASSALHAGIHIDNLRLAVSNLEHTMRADFRATPAADTFCCGKSQS